MTATTARPRVVKTVNGVTHDVTTVDALPGNEPSCIAMYMLTSQTDGAAAPQATAFVEVNTSHAFQHFERAMAERGASFDTVKFIVVTHVHLDHCAGCGYLLQRCPNATVLCHPRARPHLLDPSKLIASARRVYGEEGFVATNGSVLPCPEDRVVAVKDGEEVEFFGGRTFKFYNVEGHARHHHAVLDTGTASCFTGDSFGISYMGTLKPKLPMYFPTSTPIDFDYDEAVKSVNKIAALPIERAMLTHFGETTDLADVKEQMLANLPKFEALRVEASRLLQQGQSFDAVYTATRKAMRDLFRGHALSKGAVETSPDMWENWKMDIDINAQGLVVAAQRNPVSLGAKL